MKEELITRGGERGAGLGLGGAGGGKSVAWEEWWLAFLSWAWRLACLSQSLVVGWVMVE